METGGRGAFWSLNEGALRAVLGMVWLALLAADGDAQPGLTGGS